MYRHTTILSSALSALSLVSTCLAEVQDPPTLQPVPLAQDPGVYGPPLEPVHYFYDEWPTGIAVSSAGRMFANYRRRLLYSRFTCLALILLNDDAST